MTALRRAALRLRRPATLPDGSEVMLRPLEPEDADLLLDLFDRLGPRSREQRFLTPKHRLTATDLRQLTAVDHATTRLSLPCPSRTIDRSG